MTTLEEISERGFAVIADVVSPEVVATLVDEMQKLLLIDSRRAGFRNLFHVSPLSRTLVHSETLQSLISPILVEESNVFEGFTSTSDAKQIGELRGIRISPSP